ncbi:hypothetical protein IT084_14430 [Desulfallas sp. Bu1-1]|jgi:hypothetical protein|uniref:hypothetical protein n=1 Tax=Desulfallas sp. Bu1-1 TaxID=2787620 RepID=UPI0018A0C294|nr:hypothetical protein [Desulfallas sp. Bu1-1]MBF7084164.1 hypothetical protein [Desulfallas sp. Bu1-1]
MSGIEIDIKALSRKYRTNVARLIRAWKKGLSDLELSRRTGINVATLYRIRSDIELTHRRARLAKKMESPEGKQLPVQRHIFLRPLV